MSPTEPKWSPKDIELASKMWVDGQSGTLIGLAIGKTRSSVVGKMKRLGLDRPAGVVLHAMARPPGVSRSAIYRRRAAVPEPAPSAPPSQHPVNLMELEQWHCRAILNEPDHDDPAMYCGDPKADGSSYCPFHFGLYTQPLKERMAHGQTSERQ